MSRSTAIEVSQVTKRFDDLVALDRVDLELAAGEVHGLLGENGAGKTTLSNILSGLYKADEGTIRLRGDPVRFVSPRQALTAGIGMVHQHFKLVETLTAAQNLFLGWDQCPRIVSASTLTATAQEVADRLDIDLDMSAFVWQLSVGQQQRLEILRVLARGARVLILDEPTAVLTDAEAEALFEMLRRLVRGGQTVVFISHKLKRVFSVCDRITVLRDGRHIATASTSSVDIPTVAKMMTGEGSQAEVYEFSSDAGDVVLQLQGVSALDLRGLPAVRDVDLTVREHEVVGIAGVSGNGQTEMAAAATGMIKPSKGYVLLDGVDLTGKGPRQYRERGAGHIAEDRLNAALVRSASLQENAVICHYRDASLSTLWRLRRNAVRRFAKDLIQEGNVQHRSIDAPISQLSGGNQQRLIATREASLAARLLVAVHPTRGLDPGAARAVHKTVRRQADKGCGVLYISDDLDEILHVSDRIAVMYDGTLTVPLDRTAVDRTKLGRLMAGFGAEGGPE